MKKIFSAIILMAVIFLCAQNNIEAAHIAAYEKATVINVSDYVNLREEPSTNSAVLAKVPSGAEVEVLAEWLPSQHNGFYRVKYHGIIGCIHQNYLSTTWGR